MKAYRKNKATKTTIRRNESVIGETIEQKIERIVNNKEPITDGAPIIYTERKDGVQAGYDIRTDRFEVAIDAMDKVTKTHIVKREERHKDKKDDKSDGKAEPTQGQAGDGNASQTTE